MPPRLLLSLGLSLSLTTCTPPLTRYPDPVDTSTRPIELQQKRSWDFPALGLTVDNQFPGARLNDFRGIEGPTFEAIIAPENAPINMSPWYAFRLQSDASRELLVQLTYPEDMRHRYFPKVSTDGERFTPLDSTRITTSADDRIAYVRLRVPADTAIFLSGQELITSADVTGWIDSLSGARPRVQAHTLQAASRQGRDLPYLTLGNMDDRRKPLLVFLSRQHPPEVTGYLAFEHFIETLVKHPDLPALLDDYRIIAFPLLNPDGVDGGHFRHNAGGIDLNRDWAYFRQPETRAVAERVDKLAGRAGVHVMLDFHSTWADVFYTHDPAVGPEVLPNFREQWLRGIEERVGGDFHVNEEPGLLERPTSANYFFKKYGAVAITYEIGDGQARSFIRKKAAAAADALVELLADGG